MVRREIRNYLLGVFNVQRCKKYTGIFAISVNGVEGWGLYEKSGINSESLITFL